MIVVFACTKESNVDRVGPSVQNSCSKIKSSSSDLSKEAIVEDDSDEELPRRWHGKDLRSMTSENAGGLLRSVPNHVQTFALVPTPSIP